MVRPRKETGDKPMTLTLGFKTKTYWDELLKLCDKTDRKPADIIHRLIDSNIEKELEILRKEAEFRKSQGGDNKKGGVK